MRNLIIVMLMGLFCICPSQEVKAQVIVDGININNLEFVKMCRVVTRNRFFSNKVSVIIDYGQAISWNSTSNSRVTDERTGKTRKFNSVMDALNFMESNGWTYIEALSLTSGGGQGASVNSSVEYYFRKKEVQ